MSNRKVLIIDSNILDVLRAEKTLQAAGFSVGRLTTPHGALAKIEYDRTFSTVIDFKRRNAFLVGNTQCSKDEPLWVS